MKTPTKRDKKDGIMDEFIGRMLAEYGFAPGDIMGRGGLMEQLTKRVVEGVLGEELVYHLKTGRPPLAASAIGPEGGEEGAAAPANCRNGYSAKTVIGDHGKFGIAVPRDRLGTFEPLLLPKWERKLPGFEQKIIGLYARGMSVRDIQSMLEEQYRVEVSADFISTVTDAVHAEVTEWRNRPLEAMYPIVFFDALRVRIRDDGTVRNKAVYLALGIAADGTRDVLGMWIEQNEGAKFWLQVMNELRQRGVRDVLIAVTDGLKGFPEAISAVFPQAEIQTCIVHLIRHSMACCSYQDRREVAAALKLIYTAETEELAELRLAEFEESKWGGKYPTIAAGWRRNWEVIVPFFAYPAEVRKMMYTTNAIENTNRGLRKVLKTKGCMPNDAAAFKLIYLALRNMKLKWANAPNGWLGVANQFAIRFGERFTNFQR